jgi:hypothetical protein
MAGACTLLHPLQVAKSSSWRMRTILGTLLPLFLLGWNTSVSAQCRDETGECPHAPSCPLWVSQACLYIHNGVVSLNQNLSWAVRRVTGEWQWLDVNVGGRAGKLCVSPAVMEMGETELLAASQVRQDLPQLDYLHIRSLVCPSLLWIRP